MVFGGLVILESRHDGTRAKGALLGEFLNPSVELCDSLTELLLAGLMCRHVELPLHLGACQPQRFELPRPLGVAALGRLSRLPLFLFALFHSLGKAGFRVDESFSGITHS